MPAEHNEPGEPAQQPTEPVIIPAAHVTRIRAWLKYGMTAAQVAETYGVTASEVERILGTA